MRPVLTVLLVPLATFGIMLLSYSCRKNLTSNTRVVLKPKSDIAGVVIGTVNTLTANVDQVLTASDASSIKGVEVAFPANTLIVGDVTIQAGDTLISESMGRDLGLPDASIFSPVSPTIIVSSNATTDPKAPFVLSIPTAPASGLSLESPTYAVLYKITQVSLPGKFFVGVFSGKRLSNESNILKVQADFFGAYQVITLTSSSSGNLPDETPRPTAAPIVTEVEKFPLDGVWKKDCQPCKIDGPCSFIITLFLNGSSIKAVIDRYLDEKCMRKDSQTTAYTTYIVGKSLSEPSGSKALDVIVNRFLDTATSEETVKRFNDLNNCGLRPWKINIAQDSTATDCHSSSQLGTRVYSNYKLSGDKLYLGTLKNDQDDGTSATRRNKGSEDTFYRKTQ